MREIKFRAWDEELEMMMPPVDLSTGLQNYKWLGRADLPIMQFTGLKDKNGVEIYEKDLLGTYRTQGVIDVIGEIVFDIDYATFIIQYTNGGWAYLWEHLNNNRNTGREIIGNIYENKELLS